VFCNLDRFKYISQTKTFESLLNGEPFTMSSNDFTECEAEQGPGGGKAFTVGRRGEAEKKYPKRPDTIQLCPRWFDRPVDDESERLNNNDKKSYETIYKKQNKRIPDYPWPQTGYVSQRREFGSMHEGSGYRLQHVSQELVMDTLSFILAHEVGNLSFDTIISIITPTLNPV